MLATNGSLEDQQQRWLIDNLDSLEHLSLPDLIPATDDNVVFERLEFDLKHSIVYLSKLKFNFLELQTKRRFLEHVSDEHCWNSLPVEWAPGPLKSLEKQAQTNKEALKAIKEAQSDLKAAIGNTCETLVGRLTECTKKRAEAVSLIAKVKRLLADISRYGQPSGDAAAGTWSIPDLKAHQAALRLEIEKKRAALSVQKQAVSDLHRLLTHQADHLDRTLQTKAAVEQEVAERKRDPQTFGAIADLCRWYRGVTELTEEITGVHCDVVRPDYLHVTVTNPATAASVPIHLHIDSLSGRLVSVTIGTTASTPKVQWKELIELAIRTNDIPLLIRQVHYKLIKQSQ